MSKVYTNEYEDVSIRGIEDERPWNITDEIAKFITPETIMVDVGCGLCSKTLGLAEKVKEFIGIEPSEEMRDKVVEEIQNKKISNVHIIDGKAEKIPLPDNYSDVIVSIVAIHSASEFSRVLKQDGVAIIEKLTEQDKREFKRCFGSDDMGLRGQFLELKIGERVEKLKMEFESFFRTISIREGGWHAYLSERGMLKLCEETSTIRGFDRVKDSESLKKAIKHFKDDKGICIEHHRALIIAKK